MKQPIYVRIEPDLKEWLEKKAEKTRRTISDYVRILIQDHRSIVYESERKATNKHKED